MNTLIFTYILLSQQNGRFYVGITKNIEVRLLKHNKGGVSSTRNSKPFTLVYFKEHDSYEEARKHEKWLKKKNKAYKQRLAQLAPPKIGGVK